MKKITLALFFFFIVLSSTSVIMAGTPQKSFKIGVFFWHESGNDYLAFNGIQEGFKTAGVSCEFDVQKAFEDDQKTREIIQKWIKEKPDLIYGMGTESTQCLMREIKDTPIVFTAVTNPVQAGISPNWQSTGRNLAGNSNWIPTDHILDEFRKAVPHLKCLGVMYDPNNSVSSMEVGIAAKAVASLGLNLKPIEVKKVDDLIPATRKLVSQGVEAIWIPIDILVYSNLDKVRSVTDPAKIPLMSSSHRGVKDGAIIGMVVDYHNLGQLSVPIALKILVQCDDPKSIPIGTMKTHRLLINLKAANEIGYDIPLDILALATQIIE